MAEDHVFQPVGELRKRRSCPPHAIRTVLLLQRHWRPAQDPLVELPQVVLQAHTEVRRGIRNADQLAVKINRFGNQFRCIVRHPGIDIV